MKMETIFKSVGKEVVKQGVASDHGFFTWIMWALIFPIVAVFSIFAIVNVLMDFAIIWSRMLKVIVVYKVRKLLGLRNDL